MAIYLPFLNSSFLWDDHHFLENNVYVERFDVEKIFTECTTCGSGLVSNYYRPLTSLSFAVDRAVWDLNPMGFHLTNALMHAGAGVVLFWLLVEIGMSVGVAMVVSMLFLVHPVQTEAVSYVNSRGDSLYSLLLFAGLYLFVKSHKSQATSHKLRTKILLLIGSVVFFGLSVLAKELALAGIGLFGLVLLSQITNYPAKGRAGKLQITNKESKIKILSEFVGKIWMQMVAWVGIVGVAVGYLWLRVNKLSFGEGFDYSAQTGGSLWVRLMTFGKVFWVYVKLLVFPYPLHMERSIEALRGPSLWWVGLLAFVFALLVVGKWEYCLRKKVWIWFGVGWFLIMLVPVSGVLPMNGQLYEHWLYVPMVGFWIVVMRGVQLLFRGRKDKLVGWVKYLLAIAVVVYAGLAVRQNYLWSDPVRFYEYTLDFVESPSMYNNLAKAYLDQGKSAEAEYSARRAIELEDKTAYPHGLLAGIYIRRGDMNLAEDEFVRAVEVQPGYYPAYQSLLKLYVDQERFKKAMTVVENLLELDEDNWQNWLAKGKVEWLMGEAELAEESFGRGLELAQDVEGVEAMVESIKKEFRPKSQ